MVSKEDIEESQNKPVVHEPLSGLDDNQPQQDVYTGAHEPDTGFERWLGQFNPADFNSPVRNVILKGRMMGSDTKTWATKSPTAMDPRSIEMAVNAVSRAVDNTSILNPEFGMELAQNEDGMALLPEMTAATQDDITGPVLLEAILGAGWQDIDTSAADKEEHYRHYQELESRISPDAYAALMLNVAGLEDRFQKSLLAESIAYLDNNDMNAPNSMDMFSLWAWQKAYDKQQEGYQENTIIGAIGESLSQGVRTTSKLFSTAWAHVASPQDAWYRSQMSPGQNVAISAGQDPGTAGYEYTSGVFDGTFNLWGDPVAWTANVAMGSRAVKGTALLAQMSKPKLMLRAITPFYGKRAFEAMGVRGSTRFITNRVGMVLGAKTSDQLTTNTKALKLWKVLEDVSSEGVII